MCLLSTKSIAGTQSVNVQKRGRNLVIVSGRGSMKKQKELIKDEKKGAHFPCLVKRQGGAKEQSKKGKGFTHHQEQPGDQGPKKDKESPNFLPKNQGYSKSLPEGLQGPGRCG